MTSGTAEGATMNDLRPGSHVPGRQFPAGRAGPPSRSGNRYRAISRCVSETVPQDNKCTKHSLGTLAPRVTLGYCHVSQSMGAAGGAHESASMSPVSTVPADRTGAL